MARPASVALNPCDLCPREDLQPTRPVVSPHLSIHTCGICISHSQMWKIFWELQISQRDISESRNPPQVWADRSPPEQVLLPPRLHHLSSTTQADFRSETVLVVTQHLGVRSWAYSAREKGR